MRFLFQSKPRFAGIFAALAVVVGVATGGGTAETIANQREGRDADEIAQADGGTPEVVASYSVLCSMVEQITAGVLEPNCLIAYDQDPHTYEARPSDRRAIEVADAVFYAGMNFEPSIIEMAEASTTPAPKVAVHEKAVQDIIEVEEEGEVEPDPHIWHDVENGIRMVEVIEQTLTKIDPDNADTYTSNADALTSKLERLDAWIPKQIATIPENQRRLITTHDAMSYYSRAYGLTVEGTLLGFSTEEQPTAAQVKSLTEKIQAIGVPVLFAELTANDKVLGTVANEAGVNISENVLIADGIGEKGTPAGSYQGMLVYNTCTIVTGLGGKCSEFK
ncbi:MAG: zinc ABC transporter solute-binding protein [Okeania sp. SIO4D6]|uniref:metal ABC transporter solute-binding protein, Zn/Mn family n=2 Tax=Okeania TaxID=1458928 RepID=UPI0013BA788F|nr:MULTISPECIES: zinc ABC transporter substrate-binding protein [unclassified Okeania]NEP04101.1 zinc ABC transporter solute-binding protein [Okeania sp. SIO4D6]NEP75456.1 zinc ABC transporter solute-binding protein [Okeania sp. SIO2G5]NEP96568.1 zinc ABC transporter solute-binding protein [Okeania sp. SIO2F5]